MTQFAHTDIRGNDIPETHCNTQHIWTRMEARMGHGGG
jgi:hypothetical protein